MAGLLMARSRHLIAAADARQTPYVIDYEHQTLRSAKNGLPAPASGWFKKLEWREGVGLFAVDVEWTDAAAAAIDAGEYRFISPVFLYDTDWSGHHVN
jgi:phage I-like protein